MFRIFSAVLLAVGEVLSEYPEPKALQDMISGGLTNPSSNIAHSFFHKSFPCEKVYNDKTVDLVKQWNEDYKKLKDKGAFLPEMLMNIRKADDEEGNCYIFFKNLFE